MFTVGYHVPILSILVCSHGVGKILNLNVGFRWNQVRILWRIFTSHFQISALWPCNLVMVLAWLSAGFDPVYWIQFMARDMLAWEMQWLALVHIELVGHLVNHALLYCHDLMFIFGRLMFLLMQAVVDVSWIPISLPCPLLLLLMQHKDWACKAMVAS